MSRADDLRNNRVVFREMYDLAKELEAELFTLSRKYQEVVGDNFKLEAEVMHWKSNHADIVLRSRILLERTDIPLERTSAFRQIGEAKQRVKELALRVIPDVGTGWRQCAIGQHTSQFCGQLNSAVLAEREACAKVCDDLGYIMDYACAIRARGTK